MGSCLQLMILNKRGNERLNEKKQRIESGGGTSEDIGRQRLERFRFRFSQGDELSV